MTTTSKEAAAYREAGRAVAAFALSDDAFSLNSKDPATKSRAHEIEATISLAAPSAQLKFDPTTDVERARREEWWADELHAKSHAADAVLCRTRPGEPLPKPIEGMIVIELEEAMEAAALFQRLVEESKAFVADRWFAISSVAALLLEGKTLTGAELEAFVHSHPASRASQ